MLGFEINFKKLPADWIDSRDVAYDYGSIMHYPRTIFGKSPWDETVIPLDAAAQVGQRIKLSDPDILQAKKLYRCPGKYILKIRGNIFVSYLKHVLSEIRPSLAICNDNLSKCST